MLSARAAGRGVEVGTAAVAMVLGWVGTSFGVVSGNGQGGANALRRPELRLVWDGDWDWTWDRD